MTEFNTDTLANQTDLEIEMGVAILDFRRRLKRLAPVGHPVGEIEARKKAAGAVVLVPPELWKAFWAEKGIDPLAYIKGTDAQGQEFKVFPGPPNMKWERTV